MKKRDLGIIAAALAGAAILNKDKIGQALNNKELKKAGKEAIKKIKRRIG